MSLSEDFSSSARRYDILTRLNPGYRRELRRAARALAQGLRQHENHRPPVVWDLGCGTGLSTQALHQAVPNARIVGVDASAGMLQHAAKKSWPPGTTFVLARVEQLADHQATALAHAPDG